MISTYFKYLKPWLVAFCSVLGITILWLLGTQLPADAMDSSAVWLGVIVFLYIAVWTACEFWRFRNRTHMSMHEMVHRMEETIGLTSVVFILIFGLFGLMFYFHETGSKPWAIVEGSICAVMIPVVIWVYVLKISPPSPRFLWDRG